MKIRSAHFVKGITGTDDILYDGKFQVAFMGRSNVGKSSVINSLVPVKNLARSSSSPGKTVRMDFFLINNELFFVDFPGYGYARVSGKRQEKLKKMILWYLLFSEVTNRLVLLILDAKVGITAYDRQIIDTLHEKRIDHVILVNKIDKLKPGEREKQMHYLQKEAGDFSKIIPYSALQRIGRRELLFALEK